MKQHYELIMSDKSQRPFSGKILDVNFVLPNGSRRGVQQTG